MGADRILFWFYVRHEYGGQSAYYFDFMCVLSMRRRPHIILILCAAWVWGADRILLSFYVRHEYEGQTAYYFDFMCGLSMRGRPHIILNLCAAWVWGADRILFCPLGRRPDIALVFLCVSRLMVEQEKTQNLKKFNFARWSEKYETGSWLFVNCLGLTKLPKSLESNLSPKSTRHIWHWRSLPFCNTIIIFFLVQYNIAQCTYFAHCAFCE